MDGQKDQPRTMTLAGTARPVPGRAGGAGHRYAVTLAPLDASALCVSGIIECRDYRYVRLLRVEQNGLELDEQGVAELLDLTVQSLLRADATYLDDYAEAIWPDGETFLSNLPAPHRQVAIERIRAFTGRLDSDHRERK